MATIQKTALFLTLIATGGAAQEPSKRTFDVATVKMWGGGPVGVPGTDGGPGTPFPEDYGAKSTLRSLLFKAFDLQDVQQQVSGPGWIDSTDYAVVAKVPPGTTREDFRVMLQNLLVERFRLQLRHETIELPVYELTVAKGGPKLKPSDAAGQVNAPTSGLAPDGFPALAPGRPGLGSILSFTPAGPEARMRGQQQPMSALARFLSLSTHAGRVVVDKTGLPGTYDFQLFFNVSADPLADIPGLTVFDAIEEQLGLKLQGARQTFDKIVIESAERIPADN